MKKLFLFFLFCLLSVGVALPMENSSKKKAKIFDKQIEAKYKNERYPLHAAAGKGDLVAVKYLVNKNEHINEYIEDTNDLNNRPLYVAAAEGHLEVVKFLVLKGADINSQNGNWYESPLDVASNRGRLEVVKFLVLKGADVKEGDVCGRTPLHFASDYRHLEVVRYLVLNGADVNAKCCLGWTPLHVAAEYGHLVEVFKFLVLMDGDLTLKDEYDKSPLDQLREKSYEKRKQFDKWWKKNSGWKTVDKELKLEYFKRYNSLEFKDFLVWKRPMEHFTNVKFANFDLCIKDFNNRLDHVVDNLN